MSSVSSSSKRNGDLTQGAVSEDSETALYAHDILMLSESAVLMQILLIMWKSISFQKLCDMKIFFKKILRTAHRRISAADELCHLEDAIINQTDFMFSVASALVCVILLFHTTADNNGLFTSLDAFIKEPVFCV